MPSTVYGIPASSFVRKVCVALEEKGIAYTIDPVVPMNVSDEFRKISPLGKVPAYQDGKVTLADSSVICAYLEKTNPTPALYPSGAESYARALWFEEYSDGAMSSILYVPFLERILYPKRLNRPADENAIREAVEVKLPPMFAYLESQLKPGEWIVDNQFSIADITLASTFVNFQMGDGAVDEKKYPKLAAYIKKVHARPSYAKVLQNEQEFMKQAAA